MLDFDDLDTFDLLLAACKPHRVDPQSSIEAEDYFRTLLRTYDGPADRATVLGWLDQQIGNAFRSFGDRPRWIQGEAWPFARGQPMVFAGQIDLRTESASFPFYHDDTSLYVFVASQEEPVVVLQQY